MKKRHEWEVHAMKPSLSFHEIRGIEGEFFQSQSQVIVL
jgi:hypothetical protein